MKEKQVDQGAGRRLSLRGINSMQIKGLEAASLSEGLTPCRECGRRVLCLPRWCEEDGEG